MKKLLITVMTFIMVVALTGCGSSGGGSKAKNTKTMKGDVVQIDVPDGWELVSGTKSIGNDKFDFVQKKLNHSSNISILRDSQSVEHYKDMIDTGNYGKYIGSEKIGEGKWYIAEKVAAGPVGKYTCVVQAYDVDLNSDVVKDMLATIKWVKK